MTAKEFVLKDLTEYIENTYYRMSKMQGLDAYDTGARDMLAELICRIEDLNKDYGGEAEKV